MGEEVANNDLHAFQHRQVDGLDFQLSEVGSGFPSTTELGGIWLRLFYERVDGERNRFFWGRSLTMAYYPNLDFGSREVITQEILADPELQARSREESIRKARGDGVIGEGSSAEAFIFAVGQLWGNLIISRYTPREMVQVIGVDNANAIANRFEDLILGEDY
jgi:hypothetical protein